MNEPEPNSIRTRRPIQSMLSAALYRIEGLHLGDREGMAPASAHQSWLDANKLLRAADHSDAREALEFLRVWQAGARSSLALLGCTMAPCDLIALFLLDSIRANPRRLYREGLTEAECNFINDLVHRAVRRNLWVCNHPIVSFAALRAAARYALHEHGAQEIVVFGQELWNQAPPHDRWQQFLDASASLRDANIRLRWIPASLSPQ